MEIFFINRRWKRRRKNRVYFVIEKIIDKKWCETRVNNFKKTGTGGKEEIRINYLYVVYVKRDGKFNINGKKNNLVIKQAEFLIVYVRYDSSKNLELGMIMDGNTDFIKFKAESFYDMFEICYELENLSNKVNPLQNVLINQNKKNNKKFIIKIPYFLYTNSKLRNKFNKMILIMEMKQILLLNL